MLTCKPLKVRASGRMLLGTWLVKGWEVSLERSAGASVAPAGELVLQPRAVGRHRGL